MEYFSILELEREPFSNSPDPAFFYGAAPHLACLQQLELSVRLKRGLNVVMGHVGTGKTTISRELVRRFDRDDSLTVHLILDPSFSSGEEFLQRVEAMLLGESLPSLSVWQRKERIKNGLFETGVAEGRTIVLLIDEGQKLSIDCLEIIREFLNFETNTQKLLQVVIFAQEEFANSLKGMENFQDRINCIIHLGPMSFKDMRSMIRFRLEQSSSSDSVLRFTWPALWYLYRVTHGYPRKVVNIAHRVLLIIIVQGKNRVTYRSVAVAAGRAVPLSGKNSGKRSRFKVALIACLVLFLGYFAVDRLQPAWTDGLTMFLAGADHRKDTSRKTGVVEASSGSGHELEKTVTNANSLREPRLSVQTVDDEGAGRNAGSDRRVVRKSEPSVRDQGGDFRATGEKSVQKDETTSLVSQTGREPENAEDTAVPRVLGTLVARKDDTIFRMIRRVYGVDAVSGVRRVMRDVVTINPNIAANPDILEVGSNIVLPTPKRVVQSLPADRFWVRLAQTDSFKRAYAMIFSVQTGLPYSPESGNSKNISLVISWTPNQAFSFSLILDASFTTKDEAHNALASLQHESWYDPVIITSAYFKKKILFSSLPE
jgi:general secretion pathway protein A